jgi:hypothetical protein
MPPYGWRVLTPQLACLHRQAAAEINRNFEAFGIKPDGIINFLSNEPPFWNKSTLKIQQGASIY